MNQTPLNQARFAPRARNRTCSCRCGPAAGLCISNLSVSAEPCRPSTEADPYPAEQSEVVCVDAFSVHTRDVSSDREYPSRLSAGSSANRTPDPGFASRIGPLLKRMYRLADSGPHQLCAAGINSCGSSATRR
jgi:hypothetical protein